MKYMNLWAVTSCNLERSWGFGGTYYLHLQGRIVKPSKKTVCRLLPLVSCFSYFSTLKMEVIYSAKIGLSSGYTTNSKDHTLHCHRCGNFKSSSFHFSLASLLLRIIFPLSPVTSVSFRIFYLLLSILLCLLCSGLHRRAPRTSKEYCTAQMCTQNLEGLLNCTIAAPRTSRNCCTAQMWRPGPRGIVALHRCGAQDLGGLLHCTDVRPEPWRIIAVRRCAPRISKDYCSVQICAQDFKDYCTSQLCVQDLVGLLHCTDVRPGYWRIIAVYRYTPRTSGIIVLRNFASRTS
jgi:hypothetical protein